MVLTPPILAVLVERWSPLGLVAVIGWVLAYSIRGPLELLLGTGASGRAGMAHASRAVARLWLVLLGLAAAILLGPVVWLRPQTLALFGGALAVLGLVFRFARQGEARSLASGLLAVLGLMAGGPLYSLAGTGRVTPEGRLIAGLCAAFFVGSLFRIKAVARQRRSAPFRLLSVLLHLLFLVLAAIAGKARLLPPLAALGLLPPLLWSIRGALQPSDRAANLAAAGRAEQWLLIGFVVVTVASFATSWS